MEQHYLLVLKRFCQKQLHISISCYKSIASTVYESLRALFNPLFHLLLFYINPFWLNLFYILVISAIGFLALKATSSTPPADAVDIIRPSNTADFDLFFTSVSAMTASSMSTVEMETFSNAQLVILTVVMLLGGQVFISMLGLQLRRAHHFPKLAAGNYLYNTNNNRVSNLDHDDDDCPAADFSSDDTTSASSSSDLDHPPSSSNLDDHPAVIGIADQVLLDHIEKPSNIDHMININHVINLEKQTHVKLFDINSSLKYKSINSLSYIIFFYLLITHVLGSTLVSIYITLVPTAYNILKTKHLQTQTFSVFLTVSTFANCGFVPTNQGMMNFKQNSGLLLILIPQILLGNTLYASSLRCLIWGLEKFLKKEEYGYMLKNYHELEFDHLVSGFESFVLAVTAAGFIMLQVVVFGIMEWGNDDGGGGVFEGLSSFEKLVGFLFQGVNTRHSGESVVDLASVSPAVMMLLLVMMYLPPYTSFFPIGKREKVLAHIKKMKGTHQLKRKQSNLIQNVLFPQLIYITIFIILICITEGDKMNEDPLNFNIFNIIVEVVSAYGNVGFSTCYSCNRRLNRSGACEDTWNGFVGHWSNAGKFILVVVMIFGRLKKFNLRGGKAWKLS